MPQHAREFQSNIKLAGGLWISIQNRRNEILYGRCQGDRNDRLAGRDCSFLFRDPGDLGAAERLFQSLDTAKTLEKSDTIVRKLDRRIIADHLFFLLSQLQICSYDVSIDR